MAARRPNAALVDEARSLSRELLTGVGDRWSHTQGVASRAATALPAVDPTDRPLLLAAAWLHDIGYAGPLQGSGFHPADGAGYLHRHGWPLTVVGLVAQHSGARFVAAVRGLTGLLAPYSAGRFVHGPLADALTFADQTTGTDGTPVDVEERLADMLRRHGPDSPNARCHHVRAPALRAAVHATEQRIRGRAVRATAIRAGDRPDTREPHRAAGDIPAHGREQWSGGPF